MQSASFSSTKKDKSVKKRSSKTPAKGAKGKGSKDSDKVQSYEQPSICVEAFVQGDANESKQLPIPGGSLLEVSSVYDSESGVSENDEDQSCEAQNECDVKAVNEYLKRKVGTDTIAKQLLKKCDKLNEAEKSELMLRLAYEVCLIKSRKYDLENDAAENKERSFDTRRLFEILKVLTGEVLNYKKLTEFICRNGNVKLLKMICKQDRKRTNKGEQYKLKEEFTGYQKAIDLLQYAMDNKCPPEIVRYIAEEIYGVHHNVYNGRKYLGDKGENLGKNLDQPDQDMKDYLQKAIKLGYKDTVSVMLSGDIYHCIRLMEGERFQGENRFSEALDMIEKTVADVISLWVEDADKRRSCKDKVQHLLEKGIEIDICKMKKEDLIYELEHRGAEVKEQKNTKKEKLHRRLEALLKGKTVGLKLRRTVVCALISTLFFNYQDKLMKALKNKDPFKLKISERDMFDKRKIINELNQEINSGKPINYIVLEQIESLNSGFHTSNNWFFREVLEKIVSDKEKFDELKAVCAAICENLTQELPMDTAICKDVADVLEIFGVKVPPDKITTSKSEKNYLNCSIDSHFPQEMKNIAEEIGKWNDELSSKVPGFSGLSRKIITDLKNKKYKTKNITEGEKKKLEKAVSKMVDDIKKGIDTLASKDDKYCIDEKNTFHDFRTINSEMKKKEDKREIVELVCLNGHAKLLEMICEQGLGKLQVMCQWKLKKEFTAYESPLELLQYILEKQCSPEVVLYIVKKVYGMHHNVLSGREYLDGKGEKLGNNLKQPDQVMEWCLKQAIELSYKEVVPIMLSGDVYHCIRLMEGKRFQGENRFSEALDMIEKTVADVISLWVKDADKRRSCKDKMQHLLEKGVEIGIGEVGIADLIYELERRKVVLSEREKRSRPLLTAKLGKEKKVRLKLRSIVVGTLISTLFFNYQDKLMKTLKNKDSFILGISRQNAFEKREIIQEINSEKPINDIVSEQIKSLNSGTHIDHGWLFREVLERIVNGEEKFNKLMAVCTAICKEPMQKLVDELRKKGVTISEEVMNVLKLVGVDPLALEKSNVVPSRNIPSLQEDLTLSSNSGSEKSTSNELRQPSAETSRDLPEIRIIEPAERVNANPVPPGSKVAKKKNKGFMQSNCGQGENSSYNKGENSHRHGGKVRLTNRGAGMLSQINLEALDKKKKKKLDEASYVSGSLGRVSGQMKVHPPSIQELLDADRLMYMEKTLDKVILNYNTLSYDRLCGSSSSDHDLDESVEEEVVHELFESDDNFVKYQDAVNELVKGNMVTAKRVLLELVNDNVEPAYYAYVLMFFKEAIRQCDVLNTPGENVKIMEKSKDDINTAVQLLKRASFMEPASSFLLGMMKRYNIGECSKLMDGSWRDDLIHVVNVARERRFLNIERYILKNIDCNNKWDYEKCGLGMQKKDEYIKEMCKYSLYEITLSMLSEQDFNADALNGLFQILFEDEFPEALYSYGAALLKNKVGKGRAFKENVKEAMEYLNRAIVAGHKGAEFLLGVLPFTNKVGRRLSNDEVKFCIRKLEDYISKKGGLCAVDKENVDKAAYCLAVEYYTEGSHLVQQHDKQKAGRILRLRGLYKELVNLKDQSQIELSPSSSVSSVSERCSSAGIEGHSSSRGDDSSLFFSPLSSTKNISRASFSGFPEDYSNIDINKTPATKLSGASAENRSVFGKSK